MRRTTVTMLALLLAGCGEATAPIVIDDEDGTVEPIESPVDDRCKDAPSRLVRAVSERLQVPAELSHPKLVESTEASEATFLSAELTGANLQSGEPIATWVVVEDEIYAVNAVARTFTDWPDGTVDRRLTMTTDGGEESKTCVEAEVG